MRIFRFSDRKKKLPSLCRAPACSSSVHPASNCRDGHFPRSVNRGKVMELLGIVSQEERLEADDLLSKTCRLEDSSSVTDSSVTDDDASTDIEEDDAEAKQKTTPDLSKSSCCVDMATKNAVQGPSISSPHLQLSPPRPSVEYVAPLQYPIGIAVKANSVQRLATTLQPKPLKLQCAADMSMVLNSTHGLAKASQQTTSPHPSKHRGKHSPGYEETTRLPPSSPEKHYLPSLHAQISKEVHSIAHPLPSRPPSTRSPSNQHVPGHISGKVDMTSRQTVPCDLPSKPTQKATPYHCSMENFRMPCRTPPNSPPGTPSHQLHPQVLVNMPCRTPPNFPPETPSHQLHPQVVVNMPYKSLSPPSSARQSPRFSHRSASHPSSWPAPITNSPPHSPVPKALCPRRWTKGVILGQGSFGTVHEGLNLEDGSFFAVKVSSSEDVSPEIQHEVDVLSKLEHPNIVRYLGSSIENGRLCIFIELVRMGSLDSILRKYKRFGDNTVRSYTRQLLLGLQYLHSKKTLHRDIKCSNILVDVNGQVKLSDFGVAKQVGESLASSVKGTLLYMAPEVLKANKNCYSFPADIWSLGCTVLEMVDGKPPWSNLEGFGFLFKVTKGELPPMPEHLSPEGKDFVFRCLKFQPEYRPTATELLQHPFVANVTIREPFIPC